MHLVPLPESKSKAKRGKASKPSARSRKEQLNQRIQEAHAQAVALAYEYYVAAVTVRDAAVLEQPEDRLIFRSPILDDCGRGQNTCTHTIFREPELPPPTKQGSKRKYPPVDEKSLLFLAGQLDETSLMTATNLAVLAELFPIVILASLIPCVDSCSPLGVLRVSRYALGHRHAQGKWYPSLGFRWVICCDCPCWYVFPQQRQVRIDTWGQVTVLDPKDTPSEASREAERRARQLVEGFTDALNEGKDYTTPSDVTPKFEPPDCIC